MNNIQNRKLFYLLFGSKSILVQLFMDAVLLRTLTEKSYLKFGKYANMRVGDILKLNQKIYLRWIYFNCSMISYSDELLETLNIYDEWRINKPGIDKQKGEKLHEFISNMPHKLVKHISSLRKEKYYRNEKFQRIKKEKLLFSKSSLQAINHGHKYNSL